jgi:DNA-binding transcriptional regulator YbjK
MHKQPTESEWIDFLYGTMPDSRKSELEDWLDSHPQARERLEEMRETLGILPLAGDKEVIIPSIQAPADFGTGRSAQSPWWRTWYSVAASLLLLVMAAWLTGLSVVIGESGMHIGFAPTSTQGYSPEQVDKMIEAAISRVVEQQATQWNQMDRAPGEKLSAPSAENVSTGVSPSQGGNLEQALAAYVRQMKEENRHNLQTMMQVSQEDQRRYMEQVLADFSEFLQVQRQQDLYAIQTYLTGLQQNTEQFQLETEQILAALIRTTEILPGDRQ